jgi:hypothetical protein
VTRLPIHSQSIRRGNRIPHIVLFSLVAISTIILVIAILALTSSEQSNYSDIYDHRLSSPPSTNAIHDPNIKSDITAGPDPSAGPPDRVSSEHTFEVQLPQDASQRVSAIRNLTKQASLDKKAYSARDHFVCSILTDTNQPYEVRNEAAVYLWHHGYRDTATLEALVSVLALEAPSEDPRGVSFRSMTLRALKFRAHIQTKDENLSTRALNEYIDHYWRETNTSIRVQMIGELSFVRDIHRTVAINTLNSIMNAPDARTDEIASARSALKKLANKANNE